MHRYYSYVVFNVHVNSKSSNLYVFDKAFSEDNAFFLSSPFHFIKSIFHANCFWSFLDLFLPDNLLYNIIKPCFTVF